MKAWWAAAVLAAATSAASGCAFGDANLKAPAIGPLSGGKGRGQGREVIVVPSFFDRRPQQQRCGMKKNGYNMDTANLICQFEPDDYLADMVAAQLADAGFVVGRDRKLAGPNTLILNGTVEQMFVEPKSDYFCGWMEADVALVVAATTPAGFSAQRRFYVKGEEATMFGGEIDAAAALSSGVRQLLLSVVGAVANLADQLPVVPQ